MKSSKKLVGARVSPENKAWLETQDNVSHVIDALIQKERMKTIGLDFEQGEMLARVEEMKLAVRSQEKAVRDEAEKLQFLNFRLDKLLREFDEISVKSKVKEKKLVLSKLKASSQRGFARKVRVARKV